MGATLLLVLLIAPSTVVAVAAAATFALTPFALATTTAIGGQGGGSLARRRGAGGVGEGSERRRRSFLALVAKAKFLDAKHVGGSLEVGERRRVGDDVGGVGEAGIDAAQKVEHKLRGGDGVTDLPHSVGSLLHLLRVGIDGEITLGHAVEFLPKDDRPRLLVRLEQSLDGDVQSMRILIRLHGEVEDGVVAGVVHPPANAGVGLGPRRVSRTSSLRVVDVSEQSVLPANSGEEGLPLGVIGTLETEDDQDVLLDVDNSVGGIEGGCEGVHHRTRHGREEGAGRGG